MMNRIKNLILVIISVVAGLSLLLMPWFDLRITVSGTKLAPVIEEMLQEEMQDPSMDSEEKKTTEAMIEVSKKALKGVEINLPINVYPMKLFKASRGDKTDVEAFFNSLIGTKGAVEVLEHIAEELTPALLTVSITVALNDAVASGELPPEVLENVEKYTEKVEGVLNQLSAVKTEEDKQAAKESFMTTVDEIAADYGEEIPEDVKADIEGIFDQVVDAGMKEGEFQWTELLTNIDKVEGMGDLFGSGENGENGDEENEGSAPSQSDIEDFLNGLNSSNDESSVEPAAFMMTSAASDSSGSAEVGEEKSEFEEFIEIVENPGKLIMEDMSDSDMEMMQYVFLGAFIFVAGMPAFFWFLLALCSLIRVFKPHKKIRLWYVKIFCFGGAIFGVAMNVLIKQLPTLLTTAGAEASLVNLLGALTLNFVGSSSVVGICFLVLIGVSLWNRIAK